MSEQKPIIRDQDQLTPDYARYRRMLCEKHPDLDARLRAGRMTRLPFSELDGRFEAIFFDAFGVLNRGRAAISGAPERVRDLRKRGIPQRVVSNNASQSPTKLERRFAEMGFDIPIEEIISSGMAVALSLEGSPFKGCPYMLVGSADSRQAYAPDPDRLMVCDDLPGDDWKRAEYILMCSNKHFYETGQKEKAEWLVQEMGCPILLANPDMIAPNADGGIYAVAGYSAARLLDLAEVQVVGVGKPFSPVFQHALATLKRPPSAPEKILMVGDTLDTDILGAAAMGFTTCLTLSGVYAELQEAQLEALCDQREIRPDFVVESIK